ncbi:alkaline phosphatase D family protein [Algibacter lectus]|uniref:Phosphodiesterase/alkaline phosphatase D-like protein n=1 Tax=Algibacter lectus TaxID=221126 RepID=A0A090VKM5_9FLAO|nr:alkaline phosphatase D family protein [Algibacter lectus]GAL63889.1 phosphodiesterase/alkaline phosphatase D-like protein [Algibacter lectus]
MKIRLIVSAFVLTAFVQGCKTPKVEVVKQAKTQYDTTIAFGSCNKQNIENKLWVEVVKHKPDLWIWGGDNVYADTDNMKKLEADYNKLLANEDYKRLRETTKITGTWDDHDYGLNDGGVEFEAKKGSQQLFLDFLKVPKDSERRYRKGVYSSQIVKALNGSVKVIVLDTRYFRTALTDDKKNKNRYEPGVYGEGTILGEKQWQWLEAELNGSDADFNIIVSSIQVLSAEHGFEKWSNFPHEVDKLKSLIKKSNAKGVMVLSGDRHISEFSKTKIEGVSFPLVDFTSSGLTHVYNGFTSESNKYRVLEVVPELSFGVLKFNFEAKTVLMEMRGVGNILQQKLLQTY